MRKPKLHNDWKKCYKWFSMQAMGIAVALQFVWTQLPDDLKNSVNPKFVSYITMAILGFGVFGRIVKQGEKENAKNS